MKKRRRGPSDILGFVGEVWQMVPQQLLILVAMLPLLRLLLLLEPLHLPAASAAAPTGRIGRCQLNRNATPSSQAEIRVTFRDQGSFGGGTADDLDPVQTRRFQAGREYAIKVRSLNPRTGIVRFALGLLLHKIDSGGGGGGPKDVGRLVLPTDSQHPLIKRDDGCSAFYCEISCRPRTEFELVWTAPPTDGVVCVEIRALFTLEYDDSTWLRTSVFLCRAAQRGEQDVRVVPAAPCCACGYANYLLRFSGVWEPEAEPAVWSELLGTTHDDSYALWEFGGYPSAGVKALCESSQAGILEEEIKHFGASSVLTVIKARDLPIGRRGADQTRSAILTVNSTHHLVTFLSRPATSRGGSCVGLSLFDLCQTNCAWAEQVSLELRLWYTGPASAADVRIAYARANHTLATVSLQRIPPSQNTAEGTTMGSGSCEGGGV